MTKDFTNFVKVCGSKPVCTGQKAGWTAVTSQTIQQECNYPNPEDKKLNTQYVETEYVCASGKFEE